MGDFRMKWWMFLVMVAVATTAGIVVMGLAGVPPP